MIIEAALLFSFVAIVGVIIVKAYEWRQDVLYGPSSGGRTGTSRRARDPVQP
jgi:hypothetical protein